MIDNFERARDAVKATTEMEQKIDASYQGIYKQFVDILKKLGIVPVPAAGTAFDPAVSAAAPVLKSLGHSLTFVLYSLFPRMPVSRLLVDELLLTRLLQQQQEKRTRKRKAVSACPARAARCFPLHSAPAGPISVFDVLLVRLKVEGCGACLPPRKFYLLLGSNPVYKIDSLLLDLWLRVLSREDVTLWPSLKSGSLCSLAAPCKLIHRQGSHRDCNKLPIAGWRHEGYL